MDRRIVTNVHKEHGVITTLYGHGWKPRSKEAILEEMDRILYVINDQGLENPIRLVHGPHGDYLRTDPNPEKTNLGELAEPGRLEGYVKDEEGGPVKGAGVLLVEPKIFDFARRFKTVRFKTGNGVYVRLRKIGGAQSPREIEVTITRVRKGTIAMDGSFSPADWPLVDALHEFSEDPIAALSAYGRETGVCAICGRKLTNAASVARGTGPVCASRL